jgi:hypothetical protein
MPEETPAVPAENKPETPAVPPAPEAPPPIIITQQQLTAIQVLRKQVYDAARNSRDASVRGDLFDALFHFEISGKGLCP